MIGYRKLAILILGMCSIMGLAGMTKCGAPPDAMENFGWIVFAMVTSSSGALVGERVADGWRRGRASSDVPPDSPTSPGRRP